MRIIKQTFDDIKEELELMKPFDPNLILVTNQRANYMCRRVLIESIDGGTDVFLSEGEIVATNGVFRIDASAQLIGQKSMMNPDGGKVSLGHDHGSMISSETEDHSLHEKEDMAYETVEVAADFKKQLQKVYDDYILMKNAFVQITNKSVTIPPRLNLDMPEVNADSLIMPVYSADEKKYGVKIVSLNQDNPSKNLPFIHAIMILLDAENGKPLAILDAENLTAIRTGAASGLATKLLSNANSTVAAIFGAGSQARYQLRAICEVRSIKKMIFNFTILSVTK